MSLETIEITAENIGPTITLNKDPVSPPPISRDSSSSKPSVNFGPGIELLMNDKKISDNTSSSPTADIHLGDLDSLAKELDGLSTSDSDKTIPKSSLSEAKSDLFSNIK